MTLTEYREAGVEVAAEAERCCADCGTPESVRPLGATGVCETCHVVRRDTARAVAEGC